jgi:hypothetical protein
MKLFKPTITLLLFACSLFITTTASAKSIAAVDLSIAAPQYGNTDIPALVTAPPPVSGPNFSSKLAGTSSSSFSIWDPQNGEAYNIFGTWYVYNNGSWSVGYPINSNIIILLIAGVAIGLKVLVAQSKKSNFQLTV